MLLRLPGSMKMGRVVQLTLGIKENRVSSVTELGWFDVLALDLWRRCRASRRFQVCFSVICPDCPNSFSMRTHHQQKEGFVPFRFRTSILS